jgi:hypothetical protein
MGRGPGPMIVMARLEEDARIAGGDDSTARRDRDRRPRNATSTPTTPTSTLPRHSLRVGMPEGRVKLRGTWGGVFTVESLNASLPGLYLGRERSRIAR